MKKFTLAEAIEKSNQIVDKQTLILKKDLLKKTWNISNV